MNSFSIKKYHGNSSKDQDDYFDKLAIAIKIQRSNPDAKHSAFVFIDEKSKRSMIAHLSRNYNCCFDRLKGYGILWLDFISERNALSMIIQLKLIAEKKGINIGNTYGITNKGGTIFLNGNVIKNPDVEGDSLTCVTFLLCFLEQFGFKVIDRSTWLITDDDIKWQEEILEIIKPTLYESFYEIQKENIGKFPRVRPEQLVGACGKYKEGLKPVSYTDACEAAEFVLQEMANIAT